MSIFSEICNWRAIENVKSEEAKPEKAKHPKTSNVVKEKKIPGQPAIDNSRYFKSDAPASEYFYN